MTDDLGDRWRQLSEEQIELPVGGGCRFSWLKLQSFLFLLACLICVCCSISSYLWGSASTRLARPAFSSPAGKEETSAPTSEAVTPEAIAQATRPPQITPLQPEVVGETPAPTYPSSPLAEPTPPPPTEDRSDVPPSSGIYLVYVEYSRPGRDWTDEHVLIENISTDDQDMTGWRLGSDYFDSYAFPPGFILAGSTSVRVWSGSGQDTATELYWGRSGPAWDARGGVVYLWDAQGNVVDSWKW
jgi:competence protein ComEC